MEHRVFVAHRKDEKDAASMVTLLQERFAAEFPEADVTVTSGSDHYMENASAMGGWKGWIYEVHSGVDADEQPYFTICVVPDMEVGKATAEMIEGFLEAQKSVVYWNREADMFAPVMHLDRLPGKDDWKRWAVLSLDQG